MDSKESHQQQQNRDAAALAAMHGRLSAVFDLSLRQPQQARMLDGPPHSAVATQQQQQQQASTQRGRGRPRKYAPPDVAIDGGDSADAGPPAKRARGRPVTSRTNQQRNALGGGEGGALTAHVIDVNPGEDIAMKIMAFVTQQTRDVCILSATGAVSSAVFGTRNPIGIFRLEGQYVIISMSGRFSNTESNGTVTRIGNLSVSGNMSLSMAGPDGNLVGGCVGGFLIAESQVKVIVGTFEPSSAPANVLSLSGGGPGFPQSQGPQRSSESSKENASESPLHQVGNSTPQPAPYIPRWPGNNPQ